ncbi:hypothetical protein CXF68_12235 [Tenacibaculum sp. Bg11-29]|uniref:hypothetical protein n=1 Tax=Tenacibaculum sp. Bg11-29 TaxID=2058306 RepID=UPI000C33E37D|nr:hypothetical protein [Tenacibaculum sp. Bg11-29]PKH51401.1 hypothetical protein CXF68_12235 [Tenacibaculum sp. Bg11-29]
MELTSITEIRELKNSIKEQITKIDKSVYNDSFYGNEDEYSYRGLLGGLDFLLTDITTLTKAPNQFLKLSTYDERQAILTGLKNTESYLESPNQLWRQLDNLKQAIRPFHIRYTQERLLNFDEEISNVGRKKQLLEEEIEVVKKTKLENEELLVDLTDKNEELSNLLEDLKERVNNTNDKNEELLERISVLDEKIAEGNGLITSAKETVANTNEQLEEAKESTSTIKVFEENVEKRQIQADSIDKRTQEYNTNIENFEKEREQLNKKAKDTINQALTALEYNTARGLSASFQTQLDKIEKSNYKQWLLGAGFFLLLTIGIGIWIVLSGHTDISGTIGRIALTPFTVIGAIFCANQYIRQKNVIEDYSYKMVLAKSIVGFSEQLNNGQDNSDEYKEYIKMALSEIHQDPLRKRSKSDKDVDGGIKSGIDSVIDTAQKIVGLTKNK